MSYTKQTLTYFAAILVALLFTAQACDTTSVDDDDTIVPAGYALQLDGADIVRYENGTLEYDPDGIFEDYVADDHVVLSMNKPFENLIAVTGDRDNPRYYTPVVRVRFIDENGSYFDYPEELDSDGNINPEGEYRLNWEWEDPTDGRSANFEQHGSDGSFGFHIRADFVGTTGVTFQVNRCQGDRELVSIDGENTRVDQIRECEVEDELIWESSVPMMVRVDGDYDRIGDDGSYPNETRHERVR